MATTIVEQQAPEAKPRFCNIAAAYADPTTLFLRGAWELLHHLHGVENVEAIANIFAIITRHDWRQARSGFIYHRAATVMCKAIRHRGRKTRTQRTNCTDIEKVFGGPIHARKRHGYPRLLASSLR